MNFNKNKVLKKKIDLNLTNKNKSIFISKFIFGIKKSIGRSKEGQLLYHRGGGVKKKYRLLNTKYNNKLHYYRILQTQYNPYGNAFINLIQYKNGSLSYIVANSQDQINTVVSSKNNSKIFNGNRLYLKDIPSKSYIFNVEPIPGSKNLIANAAGTYCKIFRKLKEECIIILPSKKKKKISLKCKATIGIVSNSLKKFNKKYKAGTNRYLNKRPVVRGVAMNPVDHPHGGGEGKSTSSRSCVSPWGWLTKNVPTRKKK